MSGAKFSLAELTIQHQRIAALAEADADDAEVSAALEAIAGEVAEKIGNCIVVASEFGARAAMLKAEGKRLAELRKREEAAQERLESYVLRAMEAANIERVRSARHDIAIKKNPPSLVIDDLAEIPARFKRVEEVADKDAIKAALKKQEFIPGCHVEQKKRLEIK